MSQIMATVVLITYNHERFIGRALDSIFSQEVDFEFEVIVIDDCSTDSTCAIIKIYQAEHPNIVVFRNEVNLFGTLAATQVTQKVFTEKANGRYIFELEGDDVWLNPKKMSRQVEFMEANPDVGLTFHDWIHIDLDGVPLQKAMPLTARRSFSPSELASFSYAWILWGTCCLRNSRSAWPLEIAVTISTDMFIPHIYGSKGGAVYLDNCGPLGYRQNVGIWSTATDKKKAEYKLQTALAITMVLVRSGNWHGVRQQVVQRLLPALVNTGVLSIKG